jgi:hypothetical protein
MSDIANIPESDLDRLASAVVQRLARRAAAATGTDTTPRKGTHGPEVDDAINDPEAATIASRLASASVSPRRDGDLPIETIEI